MEAETSIDRGLTASPVQGASFPGCSEINFVVDELMVCASTSLCTFSPEASVKERSRAVPHPCAGNFPSCN